MNEAGNEDLLRWPDRSRPRRARCSDRARDPTWGWCPKGKRAENGTIPDCNNLTEMKSREYPPRTRQNVKEADATLVFTAGPLTGGSALTIDCAEKLEKPCLHVNFSQMKLDVAPQVIAQWLGSMDVEVLNVAGSRESTSPGIYEAVHRILRAIFGE